MSRQSDAALSPRNGSELEIAIVCRISGCQNQKEASLDDQEDNAKETISEKYDGPANFHVIATVGKGERLDRPELEEIEKAYQSRRYDVFVYDDLSRLIRGGEAARLLGVGVDNGTRSICIADDIDTVEPTWEEDALNACSENVAHCERTSKRVKQKTMNRFKKHGATAKRPISGYIVPEHATCFDDWSKDTTLESLILEGWGVLKATLSGGRLATFLNSKKFPRGPGARKEEWDSASALAFYRNPLLKGTPQRGNMATVKHHGSGKRVSKKNPKGPTYFEAPHLKFIEPDDFDTFHSILRTENKNYSRAAKSRQDARSGVPRKRTRACGQHARCWYCGRHYVWGANGLRDNLTCSGVKEHHCWNSMAFNGPLAATLVLKAIEERLEHIEQLGEQFHQMVNTARNGGARLDDRWAKLLRDEAVYHREITNNTAAITKLGLDDELEAERSAIKQRGIALAGERHLLEAAATRTLKLPESPAALRDMMKAEFERFPIDSLDFGDLFRELVPEMYIYLVRLCDGGHLLPRAKVRLNLVGSIDDAALVPGLRELLSTDLTLDLFETPSREEIRETVVALSGTNKQREIDALSPGKVWSQTELGQAKQLNKKMLELGLTTPYVVIHEPPPDYTKLRRHKHPDYKFLPLDGYERPDL